MRTASVSRKTYETDIDLTLSLDGGESRDINTGIGFFDHMLNSFAFHGGLDLKLRCTGDLHVDGHHTAEDCGIALGTAYREALGDKNGIRRFASAYVPMDESLAFCAADISGRPFFVFENSRLSGSSMDGFDPMLFTEFFRAFAFNAGITLHIDIKYGANPHHMIEAAFKAAARALREASGICGAGIPSAKGSL